MRGRDQMIRLIPSQGRRIKQRNAEQQRANKGVGSGREGQ
jgi:hypothetical protein